MDNNLIYLAQYYATNAPACIPPYLIQLYLQTYPINANANIEYNNSYYPPYIPS